jgi:peptide/nickel transport system substrate-binding protein
MYVQAMQRLVDQAPGFFLYDVKSPVIRPAGVQGFTCQPDYFFNYFFHQLSPA